MTDRNASLSSPEFCRLVLRWERLPALNDELGTPVLLETGFGIIGTEWSLFP